MIEIPLKSGYEYSKHSFMVNLENNQLLFKQEYLSYVENPHWIISIYRDSLPIVVSRALLANTEITTFSTMNIGRLVFVGKEATLDNLGVDNKLIWVYE